MENLLLRYVFDRKKKATETKKGLLQIEVRIHKTSIKKFISTGIRLYKNEVSTINGFTCVNHPHATQITAKARYIYNKIEAFVISKECNSIEDTLNWNGDDTKRIVLREFVYDQLSLLNVSATTIEQYNSLFRRLDEFQKIKNFEHLTYSNIIEFDAFLRKTISSQPTIYKRHSALKRMIKIAIKKKICDYNPYDDFKYKKGKSKEPIYLTEEELMKIIDYKPNNEKLAKVKDMFIFQAFTGLAFVDLINFNSSFIFMIEGKKVIKSNRQKTEHAYITLLLPQAEEILIKYKNELPKLTNQKYNDYLKLLTAGAGINKNITTHTARHTFATYLINKGVPIESVSKALGHANIKMTQHYAQILGKKVIADMSKLL